VNTVISLSFIGLILAGSILLSLRKSKRDEQRTGAVRRAHEEAHE
jgi:LPXTG-motif cell wall-anchored protein